MRTTLITRCGATRLGTDCQTRIPAPRGSPYIYAFTRWAVLSFATLTGIAMLIYPGGTLRNPSTTGYLFFQNFLSDLGTTVTWGGHRNAYGSSLFVLSVVSIVLAVVPCFRSFIRLYSSPASRKWTRAATVTAVAAAIGFIGVALTPTDRFFGIHFRGVLVAFEGTLLTALFFSFATARDPRFPRRVAAAWFGMTLLLAMYIVVLTWGPPPQTDHGLVVQVTAQKITVAGVLLIVAYQTYEANVLRAPYLAAALVPIRSENHHHAQANVNLPCACELSERLGLPSLL